MQLSNKWTLKMNQIYSFLLLASTIFLAMHVIANQDDEISKMQKALNAQVMEKPFSVEDEAKIDAYVREAAKNNLKPEVTTAPSYWRPGYTCADIYHRGWRHYRNCRYYRYYYGRYW